MDQQHDELNLSGTREPFFSIEPKRRRAFSIWFLIVLITFVLGYCAFVLSSSNLPRIAPSPNIWWWSEIVWDWNVVQLLLSRLGGDFFFIVLSAFVFTFVIHEGVPVSVHIVSYTWALIKKQVDVFNEYRKRRELERNQQTQRIAELERTIENLQTELEKQTDNTIEIFVIKQIGSMWRWEGKNKNDVLVIASQILPDKDSCLDSINQYARQINLRHIRVVDEYNTMKTYLTDSG